VELAIVLLIAVIGAKGRALYRVEVLLSSLSDG
jgi:hypothetical protein